MSQQGVYSGQHQQPSRPQGVNPQQYGAATPQQAQNNTFGAPQQPYQNDFMSQIGANPAAQIGMQLGSKAFKDGEEIVKQNVSLNSIL